MVAAARAKQFYDWCHTADTMAVMASLQCGKRFSREDFHPMMERPKTMTTCDPAAMYQWIKEQEEKRARNSNPKPAN